VQDKKPDTNHRNASLSIIVTKEAGGSYLAEIQRIMSFLYDFEGQTLRCSEQEGMICSTLADLTHLFK
jgi:hypothetical protein